MKMKIEVGKIYKTKDGRKAFICSIPKGMVVGYGCVENNMNMQSWTMSGKCTSDTSDIDLIEEDKSLEKKLDIAIKALKEYKAENWDCEYNWYPKNEDFVECGWYYAEKALKEIED